MPPSADVWMKFIMSRVQTLGLVVPGKIKDLSYGMAASARPPRIGRSDVWIFFHPAR